MKDYRETLNLPRTKFPMRAQLPRREPEILRYWEKIGIYDRVLQRRRGAPQFILHDGPPYANNDIHMGTALNKVLKDFVVKYKTMRGFDSPYVPGWDTHGLPIEHQIIKTRGLTVKRSRRSSSGGCAAIMPWSMSLSSGSSSSASGCGAAGKILT